MNDLAEFGKLAAALKPWTHQLVFVGGWAHRLYRQHPLADPPAYMPLATRDADVAFADSAQLTGSIERALIQAGFTEELMGEHRPPVSHYTLGEEDAGFYAEFLTPLRGRATRRDGGANATVETAGITAQKLRHLELLFHSPWSVTVPAEPNIDTDKPIEIRIPNPVTFITQKVLIRNVRRLDKRAQDVLYIHDTLELFGAQLPVLADLWANDVSLALSNTLRSDVVGGVREMFSTVTEILRAAARIPADRSLSPERMQAFCEQAMGEVLLRRSA